VAKRVEVELGRFLGEIADVDICPPIQFAISYPPRVMSMTRSQTLSMTMSWVRTRTAVRATTLTWVVKPEGVEDLIMVDQPRVDAFMTEVSLGNTIAMQEAKINELQAEIAGLRSELLKR
jgi:hypothetical protein